MSSGCGSIQFVSECGVSIFRVIADYESHFDNELREERAQDVAERIVEERASVTLAQRMLAMSGQEIKIGMANGERICGRIIDVATTWVLLDGGQEETLIPFAAIVEVELVRHALPEDIRVSAKLGVASILRRLAQRGVRVRIVHASGALRGIIYGVYADHLDICREVEQYLDVREQRQSDIVSVPLGCIYKISVTSTGW